MKECYFTLKTPGGEIIKLPAGISTIDKTDNTETTDAAFNTWKNQQDEEQKEKDRLELAKSIHTLTKNKLENRLVLKVIDSAKDLDNLYDSLNEVIEKYGTVDNIGSAVKLYLLSQYKPEKSGDKKVTRRQAISKLNKQLTKKRDTQYFKNLNVTGLIGSTSLRDEKMRISYLKEESDKFGIVDITTDYLSTFLSSLILKSQDTKDSKLLYKSTNIPTGKAWVDDGFIIYDKSDDLYLFLALFKREAVKLPYDQLKGKLEALNKALARNKKNRIDLENFDINKFFIGSVTEEGFMPSEFEELMDYARGKDIEKEINDILDLVSNNISPTSKMLKFAIKGLFWQLYPKTYGSDVLSEILKERKKLQEHLDAERDYKAESINFDIVNDKIRGEYYTPKLTLEGKDLFLKAKQNITLYKDLVFFKSEGEYGTYAIPRGIYKRNDNQVIVYGVRKLPNGQLSYMSEVFENSISYKKLSDSDPYNPLETIVPGQGVAVFAPDGQNLNYSIIRNIISKGDEISGKIVVGIYPEFIKVLNPKTGEISSFFYGKIKSIYSQKAMEEIKLEPNININSLIKANSNDLTAGDYYQFTSGKGTFYKRILYADDVNVYSWIPKKNDSGEIIGHVITGVPREGLTGFKSSLSSVDYNDIKTMRNEIDHIGKSSAIMSSFTNIVEAQPGDYVVEETEDGRYFGKVVENSKVYLSRWSSNAEDKYLKVKSLSDLKNPTFLTDRDISDSYAVYSVQVNEWDVVFKKQSDSDLDVEAVYVIPKDYDVKNLKLIGGKTLNFGKFQAKSAKIKDDLKDVTEEAKAILGEVRTPFIQKNSNTNESYRRNIDSLVKITEHSLNKLSREKKEELGLISRGTYVRLYMENSKSDSNIYRISELNGENVTLQLNKLSYTGKLITTEIVLTKDQLLNEDKAFNSIAELYLIKGSNKLQSIFEEFDNIKEKINTVKRVDNLSQTIDKFKEFLGSELGDEIDVEVVAKSQFKNGQKAKLETTVSDETVDGVITKKIKTSIKINKEVGTEEDVVHEFLHLFLTPLRYKLPELYNRLIQSVVKDEILNVTDAEEKFVETVAKKLASQSDPVDFSDISNFVNGLSKALELADIQEYFGDYNAIELLKMPLAKVFNLNTKEIKAHEMYNLGMVTTEPLMRQWISKNDIILKCN